MTFSPLGWLRLTGSGVVQGLGFTPTFRNTLAGPGVSDGAGAAVSCGVPLCGCSGRCDVVAREKHKSSRFAPFWSRNVRDRVTTVASRFR